MNRYFVVYHFDSNTHSRRLRYQVKRGDYNAVIDQHPLEFLAKRRAEGHLIFLTFWDTVPEDTSLDLGFLEIEKK